MRVLFSVIFHALLALSLYGQEVKSFVQKKPTHLPSIVKSYSYNPNQDWRSMIDNTWGEGLPIEEKLCIFDSVWKAIDEKFACFQNLDIDWTNLRELYRPQVEQGVSRGRFAAIMNHLALKLMEPHTVFFDSLVNGGTKPVTGIPLIYAGGWGDNSHFGAGLTPLPDSSLLVYKSISCHPLGLETGDIVLGYNGISWKILYKQLLKAELPIGDMAGGINRWGANEATFTHSWLMSAGLNWHLFDTIDVVKYNTGDTLHLLTQALNDQEMSIYCTEQLPVPGVPMPDIDNKKYISWGIVDGTKVGYIYVFSWSRENPSEKFYNAVDSLMHVYETNGLILDFRCNGGGNIGTCCRGFELLFDSEITSIKLARRIDPGNHFEMKDCGTFQLNPNPETCYDKPIAVLTGPGAFSATDFIALWLKFHPQTRFFGKSTASAYSSPNELRLDAEGWYILYSWANGYLGDFPDQFLTHVELEVDEPVWLTPDDVYRGKDSVVEAAIAWIKSVTEIEDDRDRKIPDVFTLSQNYPNPFNSSTTITYNISRTSDVELLIYNTLGKEVATTISKQLLPGEYKQRWQPENLASGIYFYVLRAGSYFQSKKMIYLK